MSPDDPGIPAARARGSRWPWLALGLAACWVVLIRIPLVLNADAHLDSDLAVDGLTLLDATQGHWRWHYPGTPYMGIAPVILSWPQAMVLGATPATLVSGGTVAYLGLVVATFLLVRSVSGPVAACWSLVPLTFASNGAVWLSGRITGGHFPAAVWQAGAFVILASCLHHASWRRALVLGVWCGLGLWLDSMFVVTLAGLIPAAVFAWFFGGARRASLYLAALFVAGLLAGVAPRIVGAWVDPYNAYDEQFGLVTNPELLLGHADLLARECLPRLIVGHKLPRFETDPAPFSLAAPSTLRTRQDPGILAIATTTFGLILWGSATLMLLAVPLTSSDRACRAVALGLILSGLVTVAGFIANRNIFNSDNYRYLVTLLVPWAFGFGLLMERLALSVRGGRVVASTLALGLAVLMSGDLANWYARFGWLDQGYRPVHSAVDDVVMSWLEAESDVVWIDGGYWDVYRVCFLKGGRVKGAPFPIYPNRFPDWQPPPGARRAVITRQTPEGLAFRGPALRAGGKIVRQARGATMIVMP
jgi:hypothetical protein